MGGEKAALLVALLAHSPGRRHDRRTLRRLLWPDADERNAQGSLRFALHRVRQALPGDLGEVLASDRRSAWLDPSGIVVDVPRFEALAREGTHAALAAAGELYRGDLLADQTRVPSDCEDWLLPERARLRDLACETFRQLFALRLWRGDVAGARQAAERCLEIDPYAEPVQAALIRLHLAQGERALAAARHRRLRGRLARDLGVEPGGEIARLTPLIASGGLSRRAFNPAWVLGREDAPPHDGKPLVAVRPFRELSDDPPAISLAAALTEDVVADLARFRGLAVLARDTAFRLGDDAAAGERLRQLGVRYVVEGSVRRAGSRVVATVALADSGAMRQLWAEQYRGDLGDLPSFQEDAARTIAAAIPVQVEQAELARIRHAEIVSMTAYELYLRGRDHLRASDFASHARAIDCFSRALERDETLAAAHATLALGILCGGNGKWDGLADPSDPAVAPARRAMAHARRAVELDPLDPQGHWMTGILLQVRHEFQAARPHLDRALRLSPGDADTLAYTGLELAFAGEAARGIAQAETSMALNPYHPPAYAEIMGKSCFAAHRHEDALMWLRQHPDRVMPNRGYLAAAAAHAGRMEEARLHARVLTDRIRHRLGEEAIQARGGPIGLLNQCARFRDAEAHAHYNEGLAMAGLAGG